MADIIDTLTKTDCYKAEATFGVSVPQTDTDVAYNITLESAAAPADRLSPATYIIDWSLPTPSGLSQGFTAYFDGNLYRFRDSRLQEYHMEWDSIPFLGTGRIPPVQRGAQFVELLPQFMGAELRRMQADSAYTLTLTPGKRFDGKEAIEVEAVMRIAGETVQEKSFIFDATTLLPLRTVTEANPGSITEQTIIVDYNTDPNPQCRVLSEQLLSDTYPEVFEKFRISNFSIENLRDTPLPQFALPTLTGERYTRHRGDSFARPTVIAIIDPKAGGDFNPQLIASLRRARAEASAPSDIIMAFATTNPDEAENISGTLQTGETALLNARSLARDCGAASLPVILVADSKGIVKNVLLGFNNNIAEVVIQTLELID